MKYEKITTVDAIKVTGYNNKDVAEWLVDKKIDFTYKKSTFTVGLMNQSVAYGMWIVYDNGSVLCLSECDFRPAYRPVTTVNMAIDPT